ncbi:bifunctional hydroxymethylpyrimidine kinase/phosphomethylpyrimidine kinase [uncultured Arthrobacter sp.]|uniref:bifunctional hydroxymethylpyrimidine kinase/phosphomethylpyrimidine kinase n=1 Tax=uncultured Arthrobacter sp. TaxID=114050 RepID=UPI00344F881A
MVFLGDLTLRDVPRVLSIAGTDPTGGAGIQADLKSIAALGGYGMAAVTSLVAQNTRGVRSVHTPPPQFLKEQLDAVSDDVRIDAVKIGMLGNVATITVVREWLERVRPPLVVLDPVMIATSGDRLLASDAEAALRELVGRAHLVTPNLPELAVLVNAPISAQWPAALDQASQLSRAAETVVLVKGGHLDTDVSPDALVDTSRRLESAERGEVFEVITPRVNTKNTHGTGCSLSSAIATMMARTGDWTVALSQTKDWLQDALTNADELQVGQGNGPINHFHQLWAKAHILPGSQNSRTNQEYG